MFRYLLLRLGYFFVTFFIVSYLVFAMSRLAPGDQINKYIDPDNASNNDFVSLAAYEREKASIAKEYYLDKAPFYLSIVPSTIPKNLYKIVGKEKRKQYKRLIFKTGNAVSSKSYIDHLNQLKRQIQFGESENDYSNVLNGLDRIYYDSDLESISSFSDLLQIINFSEDEELSTISNKIIQNIKELKSAESSRRLSSLLIPKIVLHGFDNQYHLWIKNFMLGDFGLSEFDRRPVSERIWEALRWTLLMNIIGILFAYLISIPLGVYSASKKNSSFDKIISWTSMVMYALPSFWVATLLITFFTSQAWLHWFPSGGLGNSIGLSFIERFFQIAYHLVLPIFCITYIALAFIIRQVRGTMIDTLQKDFIKTAKVKGLSKNKIIWKHGFRNSLLPLVTLFSNILPATISGSIIIEVIFSVPGMGRLAYDAINQQDWNVVFTIVMLSTVLTLFGNLFADLAYLKVDPRILFTKENSLG